MSKLLVSAILTPLVILGLMIVCMAFLKAREPAVVLVHTSGEVVNWSNCRSFFTKTDCVGKDCTFQLRLECK